MVEDILNAVENCKKSNNNPNDNECIRTNCIYSKIKHSDCNIIKCSFNMNKNAIGPCSSLVTKCSREEFKNDEECVKLRCFNPNNKNTCECRNLNFKCSVKANKNTPDCILFDKCKDEKNKSLECLNFRCSNDENKNTTECVNFKKCIDKVNFCRTKECTIDATMKEDDEGNKDCDSNQKREVDCDQQTKNNMINICVANANIQDNNKCKTEPFNNNPNTCDCSATNTSYGSSISTIVIVIWVILIVVFFWIMIHLFSKK